MAFEAEERARSVIFQRSREHLGAARERGRSDALVGKSPNRGVRDADLDRFAAFAVMSRKPPRHARSHNTPLGCAGYSACDTVLLERIPFMATQTRPCPYC